MTTLPIIAPLLSLLRSRKFIVILAGILTNVIIIYVPEIAPARDILMAAVTFLALGLATTIAWEDRAKFARDAAAEIEAIDLEDLYRDAVDEILNAVLNKAETQAKG